MASKSNLPYCVYDNGRGSLKAVRDIDASPSIRRLSRRVWATSKTEAIEVFRAGETDVDDAIDNMFGSLHD